MVRWSSLWDTDRQRNSILNEAQSLLPYARNGSIPSAIPVEEVTRIALRLKYQIEKIISCELDESRITSATSSVITPEVVQTAKSAGNHSSTLSSDDVDDSRHDYSACVVFCLLVCKKWFKRLAAIELWDSSMHDVRAVACEIIAKRIIEAEEDTEYLFRDILLKRYSILNDGKETPAANVIERAVDLHALIVIASSGYQRCNQYLWRGWLVQDDEDANRFVEYKHKASTNFWIHFNPDRMKVPLYQNIMQMVFSVVYLALYTQAINTINPKGDLDIGEGLLYIFTLGFITDEVVKFWKVGWWHFGFWNSFNITLYGLLTISFVLRMIALAQPQGDEERHIYNELSYNFLAFSAPMFWARLLLYLDTFRFFGAMLVVIKVMMKESLIFFALLIVVFVGFAQAFVGMDQVDDNSSASRFIFQSLVNGVMGSPEFDGWDRFAPPFGLVLYYIYNFIIAVVLLNILIALFNSAYEVITDNAIDEYMALFSQKTLLFVRAPDENVFIPPFNLIELFFLVIPLEWWMSKKLYGQINRYVMFVIYSPLLVITAAWETKTAHKVRWNRKRGEADEDVVYEWEQMDNQLDFEDDGWAKAVEKSRPDVTTDATLMEVRDLRKNMEELKALVTRLEKK